MVTTPIKRERGNSFAESSPRAITEMRTVLGRLVGRSHSRTKSPSKVENHRVTALIGASRRRHEPSHSSPPEKIAPCSTPSPKRRRANAIISPMRPSTTLRGSPSPAKALPSAPLAPSIPLPDSPLQVDFESFDTLFANFPLPTSATTSTGSDGSTAISSLASGTPALEITKRGPRTRLAKVLDRLDAIRSELREEVQAEQDRSSRGDVKEQEAAWLRLQVETLKKEVGSLEETLGSQRAEKEKAAEEAQTRIVILEQLLAKEQEDRRLAVEAYNHRQSLDETSELLLQGLQREVERARQTVASAEKSVKVREADLLRQSKEYKEKVERIMRDRDAEWAEKLAEAEFAHRALKESGAKLAKELAAKERIVEGMEKRMKGFI